MWAATGRTCGLREVGRGVSARTAQSATSDNRPGHDSRRALGGDRARGDADDGRHGEQLPGSRPHAHTCSSTCRRAVGGHSSCRYCRVTSSTRDNWSCGLRSSRSMDLCGGDFATGVPLHGRGESPIASRRHPEHHGCVTPAPSGTSPWPAGPRTAPRPAAAWGSARIDVQVCEPPRRQWEKPDRNPGQCKRIHTPSMARVLVYGAVDAGHAPLDTIVVREGVTR